MEFEEYVRARRLALFRFAVVLCGDPVLADEVVSDVLAVAFERWAQVSAATNVHAYVRKMVVNSYLSWRRRRGRVTPVSDLESLLGAAPEQDDVRYLVDELRSLPAKQRAAIVLRYCEGMTDAEIAEVLGSGENAVRSNISRGLAKLRIQLTESLAKEVVR